MVTKLFPWQEALVKEVLAKGKSQWAMDVDAGKIGLHTAFQAARQEGKSYNFAVQMQNCPPLTFDYANLEMRLAAYADADARYTREVAEAFASGAISIVRHQKYRYFDLGDQW